MTCPSHVFSDKTDSRRPSLYYLPYLLSLSSTSRENGNLFAPLLFVPGSIGVDRCLVLDLDKIKCVSSVEEEWSEGRVNLAMSPVFTEDVGWVDVTRDVMEIHHLGCHRLACKVVCECVVSFGELGMWDGTAFDNRLVVPE